MTNICIEECPICKHREFTPFLSCTDFYASKESFQLQECTHCNFVFTQNFPSQKEIDKYYEVEEYISHSNTSKGIVNKLYHAVRQISLKAKTKLITEVTGMETGCLLDIGCGTGYFLNEMKQKHWVVTGIEKNDTVRLLAKEKFDIDTQTDGYLYSIPKQKKDVITMWHVLEHLESLNEAMKQICNILKDDGRLIIALPNQKSNDATYYKQYWAAYDVPRHLWHFCPNSFGQLAKNHGLEIVSIKPMHFDVFYISILSEKYKNTKLATLVGGLKGFAFFCKNIFHHENSSSLIYILKKKL